MKAHIEDVFSIWGEGRNAASVSFRWRGMNDAGLIGNPSQVWSDGGMHNNRTDCTPKNKLLYFKA